MGGLFFNDNQIPPGKTPSVYFAWTLEESAYPLRKKCLHEEWRLFLNKAILSFLNWNDSFCLLGSESDSNHWKERIALSNKSRHSLHKHFFCMWYADFSKTCKNINPRKKFAFSAQINKSHRDEIWNIFHETINIFSHAIDIMLGFFVSVFFCEW